MLIYKIPYYFSSCFTLFRQSQNKRSLFAAPFQSTRTITLKNGLQFEFVSLLDVLIIKETIFDDAYNISHLQNPSRIIDIGGGLGEFAIFAAKTFPDAEIITFEPNKHFFELLKKNMLMNNVSNIKAYNIAIGGNNAQDLYIPKEFAEASFLKTYNAHIINKVKVKSRPLEEFIDREIDLLKIDCEGGEWEILSSLPIKKFQKIKHIALEYHRKAIPNIDRLLYDLLSSANFICKKKTDPYNTGIGYLFARNKRARQ